MTKESTNIRAEITDIAQRLERLSVSLLEHTEPTSKQVTLIPGDTVRILHSYRNRKGLIGVVQRTTPCFAYVQLDSSEELHRIHKNNLKKTSQRR